MKYISLILSYIVIISQSIQIYPTHKTLNYQWEDQIWQDCNNKDLIVPSNCDNNEQEWNECYTIPENGLCLINNFTIDTTKTNYLVGLTFKNIESEQTIQVFINDLEPQSIILNSSKNNVIQKIQLPNPSASLGIKIVGTNTNTNAQLSNLLVTTECSYSTDDCSQCPDGEFLFNYLCTSETCFDQLGQVTDQMMVSSMGELDTDNNYQLTIIFNVAIGDCLVPKIYLTKSLTDTTILSVLDTNQLTVDNTKTVKFFLTFDQVKSCQEIDTDTRIVYQCYVGIAITYSKVTQYLLILIGQISVDKQTSSTSQITQIFDVPKDNSEIVGPILVISEIKVNTDANTVIATQEVTDPQFKNSTLNFTSATAFQNGNEYLMNLLNQSIDQGQANYTLKSVDQQFDTSYGFNLTVESTITNSGRRLLSSTISRNSMVASYSANNLFIFKGKNNLETKPIELPLGGGYVALIAISMLIVTIFLTILTSYILDKFNKQEEGEAKVVDDQQKQPQQIQVEIADNQQGGIIPPN